jgi:hypothetical protein
MGTNPLTEIIKMTNEIFDQVISQQASEKVTYANPEEYRKATSKRFRMSKEEQTTFGNTEEGRQKAFLARQESGKLV